MDGFTTVTLERMYIIYNVLKLEERAFEYASKMVLWWLSYKNPQALHLINSVLVTAIEPSIETGPKPCQMFDGS